MPNNNDLFYGVRLTAGTVAFLLASGAAVAQMSEEVAALAKPESTLSLGLGYAANDARRFGTFTGIDEEGVYILGDVDVVRRNDDTGTWIKFSGRDLGLESREAQFEHERQGDWGYAIGYSQITRNEPYTVNTGLAGLGTTTQTPGGTALRDVDLESQRDILTLAVKKYLPANFDFRLEFRNEEKDGDRLWGQGTTGGTPNNFFFISEPLDSTTRQIDAVLSYVGKNLQVSGGYYGSFYDQHKNHVDVIGGAFTPISTPPGNHAHQIYLTGGYNFTPTTRGTFKVAYGRAVQEENFVDVHTGGRTNADAGIDTFSAHLGVTARPVPKLSLRGNLHYEDRDDTTPVDTYITGVSGTSTHDGTNVPHSRETVRGNVEASYRLPHGFRVTGGVDVEQLDRTTPMVRSVVYRKETDETSYRVELQRSLSETVNGRISYTRSERDGSAFLTNFRNNGTVGANVINPLHFADRDRDKVRLMLDWTPLEALSLQFAAHVTDDEYGGANPLGPEDGSTVHYSVDAAYQINWDWQATAWYTHEDTDYQSRTCAGQNSIGPNLADRCDLTDVGAPYRRYSLENTTDAVGIGIRGTVSEKLKVGADVSHSFDRGEFIQTALLTPAVDQLPNVHYRHTRLNLFATYAVKENAGFRVDYIHDRWNTNDWQWSGFTFADGTTVSQDENQILNFVGLTAYYKFR